MRSEALVVLVFALAIADCNSEVDALAIWKAKLVDPNNVLQSWNPTLVTPCTWAYVLCNSQDSVTVLSLGNAGLSGALVPELGILVNLQYLEVYGNKISGSIPPHLGNLTKLVSLDLYHNRLSGPIPAVLGNLRSLRFLRLHGNKLSGKIPDSIFQLIKYGQLQILNLSDNRLAGTVPATN